MAAKSQRISFYIVSILYLLLALFIVNTPLSDRFFLPSISRNISVPVYYWLITIAYLLLRAGIFKEKKGIKGFLSDCLVIGFPLHLYFLLGNLLSQLLKGSPLSFIYLCYILMVTLFFTLFLVFSGVSNFNNRPLVFAPLCVSTVFLCQVNYLQSFLILCAFIAGLLLARRIPVYVIGSALKRLYSNERLLILTIFIFAFIFRYAFSVNLILKTGYDYSTGHSFTQASDDGPTYDDIGIRLMKDFTGLFRGEIPLWGHWDYAYGIFLGAIYSIFGRNFYIATFFQSILGALIPVFLFLIGKMEFSKKAGLVAALITSLNEPLIFLSTVYGHEVISLPSLIFLVFLMVKLNGSQERRKRWVMIIASGLFLGILVLVRSLYAYFFLLLAAWFLFFRKSRLLNRIMELGAIAILACLVVFWTFKITGNSLVISQVRVSTVWAGDRTYPPFTNISNKRFIAIGVDPFSAGIKKSAEAVIRRPFLFLRTLAELVPLRVIAYFEAYQYGYFDPIYMVNNSRLPAKFPSNLEFYTTIFFLTGLVILVKNRKIFSSPLFLPLFYNVLVYGIIFAQQVPRFREASIPFIYSIGAVGIAYFLNFINSRKKESRIT